MEVFYKGKRPCGTGNRYTREIIKAFQRHQHPAVIAINPSARAARTHLIECKRSKITVNYDVHVGYINLSLYEVVPATAEVPFSRQVLTQKMKIHICLDELEEGTCTVFHQLVNQLIKWLTKTTAYTHGLSDKPKVHTRPGADSEFIGGKIVGVKSETDTSNILLESGYSLRIPLDERAQVGQYLLHTPKESRVITQSEFLDNYTLV